MGILIENPCTTLVRQTSAPSTLQVLPGLSFAIPLFDPGCFSLYSAMQKLIYIYIYIAVLHVILAALFSPPLPPSFATFIICRHSLSENEFATWASGIYFWMAPNIDWDDVKP